MIYAANYWKPGGAAWALSSKTKWDMSPGDRGFYEAAKAHSVWMMLKERRRGNHSSILYSKWCHLLWPNNSISNLSGTFGKWDSLSMMTAGSHFLCDGMTSAYLLLVFTVSAPIANLILGHVCLHLPWMVFIRGQHVSILQSDVIRSISCKKTWNKDILALLLWCCSLCYRGAYRV